MMNCGKKVKMKPKNSSDGEKRARFVIHAAGDLRPPEMQAGEICRTVPPTMM